MSEKTWVEFMEHYSICKETGEIKSHARTYYFGRTKRNKPDKILKIRPDGFVKCGHKTINTKKLYKDLFGVEIEVKS